MHQTVVAVLIESGIGTVHLTQRTQHIVGNLFARCGRHPGVEVDAIIGMSSIIMAMIVLEQWNAVGTIENGEFWRVFGEFL